MENIKERSEIESQYQWDLTTMYKSDEAWELVLQTIDGYADTLRSFEGTLHCASSIADYMKCKSEINRTLEQLYTYSSLRHSQDTRDAKAKNMEERIYSKIVNIEAAGAFAEPELFSLDGALLDEMIQEDCLKEYRFELENIIRNKSHTLSTKEEQLLSQFQEALRASSDAANMLMDADLVFDDIQDKDGNVYPLSNANFISYQMSEDRVLRKNAFHSYYRSFKQYVHTLASTYAGVVKDATTTAKVRHFQDSRTMSLFANNIPVNVYDTLIQTIHQHMDLLHRYVALRKKILSLDELHYYDLYTPLSNSDTKKYTYEQAKRMVLDAVKPLGDEYGKCVQMAYDQGWIDVFPNKGKTGGAYSSGTYDSNPFILLNYNQSLDAVSTLAHEMGHSIHSWLTNHTQPFHYSNYSLFVAEVASTVNENLLIEQLLTQCNDPKERLALLDLYLEGFKGTVYRQTMFAEFEMKAHALKESGQSLDADTLCAMYRELIEQYFGDELVIDDEIQYEWARIPHFYRPFYVYVYATGFTSAVAISEAILQQREIAQKRYLDFLSMGSSMYPLDELKYAGVDLTSAQPLKKALSKFEMLLKDAELTFEKINQCE